MRDKHEALPKDIQWHFIGHLQTNKIKYIIPYVTLIHSIDTANLLEAVNKEAKKHERVVDCLLQFHIAQEETKFGLDLNEARQLLESESFKQMEDVRICGVMGPRLVRFVVEDTGIGIPPENAERIFEEFVQLNDFCDGTGIGLTVARSLARRMGGDVQLDSSYTGGARFFLTLPC